MSHDPNRVQGGTAHPVDGQLNGILPSMAETEVFAIADDGTETRLTNIESVTWTVSGRGEVPARATVTFIDAEIDAEGESDVEDFTP